MKARTADGIAVLFLAVLIALVATVIVSFLFSWLLGELNDEWSVVPALSVWGSFVALWLLGIIGTALKGFSANLSR